MKKYLLSIVVVGALTMGLSQSASAQERNYVKVRPSISISLGARPARPSRAHVWISDEWTYRGGSYVHVAGRWETPPAHRRTWVAGYWKQVRGHGHYWVSGHWA